MRLTIILLLFTSMTVSGCARLADSRINPLNWFGRSENVANVDADGNIRALVPTNGLTVTVDSRQLVASVTSLRINRSPDGAIVQATGATSSLGYYNAELVPVSQDGGTLTLAMRATAPAAPQTGVQQISAAYLLSNAELSGIRRVVVQGQSNSLSSRR